MKQHSGSCTQSSGESPDRAEYIFNAANWDVSQAFGVEDYRMVEFGKAKGAFVAAVASKVRDIRPTTLFVDRRNAEANECMATLMSMADKVVVGL